MSNYSIRITGMAYADDVAYNAQPPLILCRFFLLAINHVCAYSSHVVLVFFQWATGLSGLMTPITALFGAGH